MAIKTIIDIFVVFIDPPPEGSMDTCRQSGDFVKSSLAVTFKSISNPAHAQQKRGPGRNRLNFLSQIEDVSIHGTVGDGRAMSPSRLDQLVAREDAAAMPDQSIQETKLLGRYVH